MSIEVDVLLFEIAGRVYGTDVTQVSRISRSGSVKPIDSILGTPATGQKALIFNAGHTGERALSVDVVRGVRRMSSEQLRRLPVAAAAPRIFAGAWLDGDATVLLVDMSQMVQFAERKNA